MIDVYIREARVDDVNFIINSWIKSFEKYMYLVPKPMYYAGQRKLITRVMARGKCFVASNHENRDQIFGWIIYESIADTEVLHYVYVKHPYRRYGIGNQLLQIMRRDNSIPCIATSITPYLDYVKKKWNIVYNPYLLLGDH